MRRGRPGSQLGHRLGRRQRPGRLRLGFGHRIGLRRRPGNRRRTYRCRLGHGSVLLILLRNVLLSAALNRGRGGCADAAPKGRSRRSPRPSRRSRPRSTARPPALCLRPRRRRTAPHRRGRPPQPGPTTERGRPERCARSTAHRPPEVDGRAPASPGHPLAGESTRAPRPPARPRPDGDATPAQRRSAGVGARSSPAPLRSWSSSMSESCPLRADRCVRLSPHWIRIEPDKRGTRSGDGRPDRDVAPGRPRTRI